MQVEFFLQQKDLRDTTALQMYYAWAFMLCARAARVAVRELFERNNWLPEIPPTIVR